MQIKTWVVPTSQEGEGLEAIPGCSFLKVLHSRVLSLWVEPESSEEESEVMGCRICAVPGLMLL